MCAFGWNEQSGMLCARRQRLLRGRARSPCASSFLERGRHRTATCTLSLAAILPVESPAAHQDERQRAHFAVCSSRRQTLSCGVHAATHHTHTNTLSHTPAQCAQRLTSASPAVLLVAHSRTPQIPGAECGRRGSGSAGGRLLWSLRENTGKHTALTPPFSHTSHFVAGRRRSSVPVLKNARTTA